MDDYKEWVQNFSIEWFSELLISIEKNCSKEKCSLLLEQCGAYHYKSIEHTLEKYIGDLQGFLNFMAKEHGQIISYDEINNIILVDENKSYCVCPITQCMKGKKVSPVLCHCSERMTQKMISKITGKEAKGRVVTSVLRGDKSCVYEIKF